MKSLKISAGAKKAVVIGSLCSISYLAVYVARNILGAISPQLTESGVFTLEQIGTLSGTYFACYAIGQLINGFIGDKIKAKYMIGLGLALAGITNALLAYVTGAPIAAYTVYGLTGFFLSMIYGPMTKVVAENTEPVYATRCSLGYTFASFIGSPFAGILASFLPWQSVFVISSVILLVMGAVVLFAFSALERKKLIEFGKYKSQSGALSVNGIKTLVKRQIVKFIFVAVITGVVRTAVINLFTLYLSERLGFSAENAAQAFTVATFIISFTTFIAIFAYEKLRRNMELTILIAFSLAAIFFTGVFFISEPIVNIVLMVIGIMSSNAAATMMYSRYCPSLFDTGMVSTATGFLDFMSYMAAALASTVFTGLVKHIGWSNIVLIWIALMVLGVIVALPYRKFKKAKETTTQ